MKITFPKLSAPSEKHTYCYLYLLSTLTQHTGNKLCSLQSAVRKALGTATDKSEDLEINDSADSSY